MKTLTVQYPDISVNPFFPTTQWSANFHYLRPWSFIEKQHINNPVILLLFCAFTLYKTNLHDLNFVIIKICFEIYNNKLYFLDTMKLTFNCSIPWRIIFKS